MAVNYVDNKYMICMTQQLSRMAWLPKVLVSTNRVVGDGNGSVIVSCRCPGQATMATSIHPKVWYISTLRIMQPRKRSGGVRQVVNQTCDTSSTDPAQMTMCIFNHKCVPWCNCHLYEEGLLVVWIRKYVQVKNDPTIHAASTGQSRDAPPHQARWSSNKSSDLYSMSISTHHTKLVYSIYFKWCFSHYTTKLTVWHKSKIKR